MERVYFYAQMDNFEPKFQCAPVMIPYYRKAVFGIIE